MSSLYINIQQPIELALTLIMNGILNVLKLVILAYIATCLYCASRSEHNIFTPHP